MIDFTTTQCLLFPEIFAKPAVLQFDQRQGSSDGGAILLKAAERRYGLIGGLAGCLRDQRQAGKVDHPLKELLAQRVFSIARVRHWWIVRCMFRRSGPKIVGVAARRGYRTRSSFRPSRNWRGR